MRLGGRRSSGNIEDRRGGGGYGRVAGGFGIGTIVIIILALLFGQDPTALLQQGGSEPATTTAPAEAPQDEAGREVAQVLALTEDVWNPLFEQYYNSEYREPRLVLFSGSTQSACGFASAATGPFYCPADSRVFIDLEFMEEMQRRFNAPGDFAQAYIIAHEVGHHIQNLLGITRQVSSQRGKISEAEYNKLSVRLELQADFLAGVWAHHASKTNPNLLEAGDIEEALRAAAAVGDDRIQQQSRGYVVPESFTHGTSEQRMRWFTRGYQSGDLRQGDTFNARDL